MAKTMNLGEGEDIIFANMSDSLAKRVAEISLYVHQSNLDRMLFCLASPSEYVGVLYVRVFLGSVFAWLLVCVRVCVQAYPMLWWLT